MLVSKVLIRSAKINKVYQDYRDINVLMNVFQNTFGCLPGDCNITELPINVINGTPSGCFNLSTTTGMGNANTTGNSVGTTSALSPPIIAAFGTGTISTNANRTCAFYEMQAFEPQAFGGRTAKNSLFGVNKAWAIGQALLSLSTNPTVLSYTTAAQANLIVLTNLQNAGTIQSYNNQMTTMANTITNSITNYLNTGYTSSHGLPALTAPPNLIPGNLNSPLNYGNYNWYTSQLANFAMAQCGSTDCSRGVGYNGLTQAIVNQLPSGSTYVNMGLTQSGVSPWNNNGTPCGCIFYCNPASSCQYYNTGSYNCSLCTFTNYGAGSVYTTNGYNISTGFQSDFQTQINNIVINTPTLAQYQSAVQSANSLAATGSASATTLLASSNGSSPSNTSVVNSVLTSSTALGLVNGCTPSSANNYCASQISAASAANSQSIASGIGGAIVLNIANATQPVIPGFQSQAMWELRTAGSNGSAGFYPYELNDTANMGYMKNQTLLIARSSSTNNITDTTNDMSVFNSNFAFKIDQKYDDGMPYTGSIIAGQNISQMSPGGTGCTTATTISVATPTASPTANYIASNSSNLTYGCVVCFGLRLT